MDEKYFGVIMLLFFACFVGGIAVGSIVRQDQFDRIDFSKRSLEIELVSKEIVDNELLVNITFKTLERTDDLNWVVIEKPFALHYNIEDYHLCREAEESKELCMQEVVNDLKIQVRNLKADVRTGLEEQKTKPVKEEFVITDVNLSVSELNEG